MYKLLTTEQQGSPECLPYKIGLSKFLIGLIGYSLLMFTCQAQTVTITGNIPYAKSLVNPDGSLAAWTMSKIRGDKNDTVNPIEGSVMIKDINSRGDKLGDQSFIPNENKFYEGTLDLKNAVLPATIAILVDDNALLTVTEIERDQGVTGPNFSDKFEVKGTALWNPKSYKEFPIQLPPGRKYKLNLTYSNTANLTKKYEGKVDVDGVSVYVSTLPVDMAVDADRDGAIRFDETAVTSPDKPFRFWINEDNDKGDDATADDLLINYEIFPNASADLNDDVIDCLRDLEDFTRLHIDLGGIKDLIKNGSVEIGLRFTDITEAQPSIRVYLARDRHHGSDSYLFNRHVANAQVHGNSKYSNALLTVTNTTAWLPKATLEQDLNNAGRLHLIFEGVATGKAKLALVIKIGEQTQIAPLISMEMMNVRKMYEHWTVLDTENVNPEDIPLTAKKTTDSGTFAADGPELSDSIVFVHGWRMQLGERRNFADTSFKRLWQIGFAGKFYHFSWPTEYTDRVEFLPSNPPAQKGNYARSERKAYLSGRHALKDFLQNHIASTPAETRIFAHSMGGIVVSEALLHGARVHTFASCQVAMAGHAYGRPLGAASIDRKPITRFSSTWTTPEAYANYPPTRAPYYQSIRRMIYNFHNEDDSALGAGWQLGQDLKPNNGQKLSPAEHYFYDKAATQYFYKDGPIRRNLNFANNTEEIYAHGAQAQSYPLGAKPHTMVRGNFDLKKGFTGIPEANFTNTSEDHSAQFRGTMMIRYPFWRQLISPACFNSSTYRKSIP